MIVLINEQGGIQYPKTEGILWTGSVNVPVTLYDGTQTTITINITDKHNIKAETQIEAEQYIKDHLEEFLSDWEDENHSMITSHNLPQIDINAANPEDLADGQKLYWTGSFYMQITLDDGTTCYETFNVTVNDKIVLGNKAAVEQYIRENIDKYISEWESRHPNQYISSWKDLNCESINQFQFYEVTDNTLKESGLTDYEIDKYFLLLSDGTYIMQTEGVDRDFPNMQIRDMDNLLTALNYARPSVNNICLTKDELSELGENIFDKVQEILSSQKLANCCKANIDCEIGDFDQGKIGDCWFLSSILSLNQTPAGKQIIRDSIRWNSDYTGFIVTFAGENETVEVSVEELINADPDNDWEATYMGDG